MSKKQKAAEAEIQEINSEKQDQISEGVLAENVQKSDAKAQKKALKEAEKAQKQAEKKKAAKKTKKPKEKKGGLIKKSKETVSELKKVTWPTFGEVVKKTGVVVAFVVIFAVFLFGVNYVLGGLVNLLVNGTWM